MADSSLKQAEKKKRTNGRSRKMTSFEVLALDRDRELIRSLAKRLADTDPGVAGIRSTLRRTLSGGSPKTGGILRALRRSPLVGANLNLTRSTKAGRKVNL